MAQSRDKPQVKSMRHRQILDAAAEHPDASMSELASMIPSATTDLVERILEKHGDPAGEPPESVNPSVEAESSDSGGSPDPETAVNGEGTTVENDSREMNGEKQPTSEEESESAPEEESEGEGDSYPSPGELTTEQRETLRAIAEQPDATQEELTTELDVSAPTISTRVNSIEGFDWADRRAFVEEVFDTDDGTSQEETMTSDGTELRDEFEQLAERLSALEGQIERMDESSSESSSESVFEDPELVHKVVHACLEADTISEEEEMQILKAVLD